MSQTQDKTCSSRFLGRAASIVEESRVRGDASTNKRYATNVTGVEVPIVGVIQPKTTQEVSELVKLANELQQPLYVFSQGKNWGMGSKCPATKDCVVLDLSLMHQIRKYDQDFHYVVLEPGVTQGQLYDFLEQKGGQHLFNATGSGRETSILGNSLDRGVGYFSSRATALSGLEVVLPNGDVIQTGFGAFGDDVTTTHLYPQGVGPSLDGLFSQSNLGIVTAAGFRLLPAPEHRVTAVCKIPSEDLLPNALDALKSLYDEGVISTSFHIANQARASSTFSPILYDFIAANQPALNSTQVRCEVDRIVKSEITSAWTIAGAILGQKTVVNAQLARFKKVMKPFGEVRFTTQDSFQRAARLLKKLTWLPGIKDKLTFLQAAEPIFALTRGIPTDVALKSIHWPIAYPPNSDFLDPDSGKAGFLHCLPIIPLDGKTAWEASTKIRKIIEKYGFDAYVTLNVLDGRALEGVINVIYDQAKADQQKVAQECIAEATDWCIKNGFPPYRLGNQLMGQVLSKRQETYSSFVTAIKQSVDPGKLISPGKYQ